MNDYCDYCVVDGGGHRCIIAAELDTAAADLDTAQERIRQLEAEIARADCATRRAVENAQALTARYCSAGESAEKTNKCHCRTLRSHPETQCCFITRQAVNEAETALAPESQK